MGVSIKKSLENQKTPCEHEWVFVCHSERVLADIYRCILCQCTGKSDDLMTSCGIQEYNGNF